ncbi:MAG: hypothetical protein A3F18_06685 [Legionellales bacterium RIFCSPHIGHO2_12_FULL_37_14]|nr:MAG: hypothetical protein A3F18_06685 [Legionellales bacterium RIFCSPHIGHO2_12_FULL_37_14]
MITPDLTTMIINISQSLVSVIYLLKGFSYLVGLFFFYHGFGKLKEFADRHAQSPSSERGFVPLAYFFLGAMLILLPESVSILSTTVFGLNNVLAYTKPRNPNNLIDAIAIFVKTAGFIWVLRGIVLLAQASAPGTQQGPKGMAFLFGGIIALNFEGSISMFNTLMNYIATQFLKT